MKDVWLPVAVLVAFVAALVLCSVWDAKSHDYASVTGVLAKVDCGHGCGVATLDNGGMLWLGDRVMVETAKEACGDKAVVKMVYDHLGYVTRMEWSKNNGGGTK